MLILLLSPLAPHSSSFFFPPYLSAFPRINQPEFSFASNRTPRRTQHSGDLLVHVLDGGARTRLGHRQGAWAQGTQLGPSRPAPSVMNWASSCVHFLKPACKPHGSIWFASPGVSVAPVVNGVGGEDLQQQAWWKNIQKGDGAAGRKAHRWPLKM